MSNWPYSYHKKEKHRTTMKFGAKKKVNKSMHLWPRCTTLIDRFPWYVLLTGQCNLTDHTFDEIGVTHIFMKKYANNTLSETLSE